jgi:LPS sulfotransferase NodH
MFTTARLRRLVCFGTSHFPDPEQVFAYEFTAHLADSIGAEPFFVHYEKSDPREGGGRALRWSAHGLLAPQMDHPMRADLHHFRATMPERLAATIRRLAGLLGVGADDVQRRPEFLAALSQARWVMALAPDVIVTFYEHQGAFTGLVASLLLDVPRVHFHYPMSSEDDAFAAFRPDVLRQADVLCVKGQGVRHPVEGDFAGAVVSQEETPSWQFELAACVNDRLRDAPSASTRSDIGPRAAFATATRSAPVALAARTTPFVVVAAERTGSNLLVDMLTTHPDVTSAGELFNTRLVDEGRLDTQLPEGVDADEILRLRREDPAACHEALLAAAARQGAKAAGFKLLYYHMLSDNRVVARLLSLPDLRVVHLVRRDRVARYVSHALAERTDLWWRDAAEVGGLRRPHGPIEIDPRLLSWDMRFVEQLEDRARATFAGVRGLEIAYEDLVADLDGTAARVLELLGAPPCKLTPKSQKQGDGDARRRIANWESLRAIFRGTRWSPLF